MREARASASTAQASETRRDPCATMRRHVLRWSRLLLVPCAASSLCRYESFVGIVAQTEIPSVARFLMQAAPPKA